jgi:phospholipid-translocating ATPase
MSNKLSRNKHSIFYQPILTTIKYFSITENNYFLIISIFQLLTLGVIPKHWSPTGAYSTVVPLLICLIIEIVTDLYTWTKIYINDYKINNTIYKVYKDGIYKDKLCQDIEYGDILLLSRNVITPVDMILLGVGNNYFAKISLANLNGESNIVSKYIVSNCYTNDDFLKSNINIELNNNNEIDLIKGYIMLDNDIVTFDSRNFIVNGSETISDKIVGLVIGVGDSKKLNTEIDITYKEDFINKKVGSFMMNNTIYLLITLVFIVSIYRTNYSYNIFKTLLSLLLNIIQSWIVLNGIIPFSIKILLSGVRELQCRLLKQLKGIEINKNYLIDQVSNVDYILSDKTGTITKNCLEVINFIDSNLNIYSDTDIPIQIIRSLGLCISYDEGDFHTVEDKSIHSKYLSYNSSIDYSRDLVNLRIGDNIESFVHIDMPFLKFGVERPISSNIFKSLETGKYYIFTKSSIAKFISITTSNNVEIADNKLSELDPTLRLLALGYKEISIEEVESCKHNKNPNILECNLEFVCIVGIRDNLVENVDRVVDYIRSKDKSIVLLTGDRRLTAVEVSKQAGIIKSENILIDIEDITEDTILTSYSIILFNNSSVEQLLIKSFLIKHIKMYKCNLVGYSLTPTGKKIVAEFFQCNNIKTLAIGDGFNDIPMITTSSIGVSLSSKISGYSDFSLNSILDLPSLIHYSNLFCYRNSVISILTMYKSLCIGFVVFFYLLDTIDTSSPLFNFFIYQGFHLIWCLFHLIKYSIDINDKYKYTDTLLSSSLLTYWIIMSFILCSYLYSNYSDNKYNIIFLLIGQINFSLWCFTDSIQLYLQLVNYSLYIIYTYLIGSTIDFSIIFSKYSFSIIILYSYIKLYYK